MNTKKHFYDNTVESNYFRHSFFLLFHITPNAELTRLSGLVTGCRNPSLENIRCGKYHFLRTRIQAY